MSDRDQPGRARRSAPGCVVWVACVQMILSTSCTQSQPDELAAPFDVTDASPSTDAPEDPSRALPVAFIMEHPEFPVQTQDGVIDGKALPASRRRPAESCETLLAEEIRLYPLALSKEIKLRQIVLCEELSFNATRCSSFTDVERGSIYMAVHESVDAQRLRWTIHHELFHQLDYAGDSRINLDPGWESLNPVGFRYTVDVERLQTDAAAVRTDTGVKGFVNRYAMASPAEDKAELFALLVIEPEQARSALPTTKSCGAKPPEFAR